MSLGDAQSLGPKSEQMLSDAGIETLNELRQLGSVEAFARVREHHPEASLNLLWALESALTGETWQEVSRNHRTSLLLALDDRLNADG